MKIIINLVTGLFCLCSIAAQESPVASFKSELSGSITISVNVKTTETITIDFGGNIIQQEVEGNTESTFHTGLGNSQDILMYGSAGNITGLSISADALIGMDISQLTELVYISVMGSGACYLPSVDLSNNTKIEGIQMNRLQIEEINILTLRNLKMIEVSYNKLVNLDISRNPDLTHLQIYDNELQSLDFSGNRKLTYTQPQLNRLKFSTMPIPDNRWNQQFNNYQYYPQKAIEVPAEASIVDLSSEYMIEGEETTYGWYTVSGESLVNGEDYVISEGITYFLKTQPERVFCILTNPLFPDNDWSYWFLETSVVRAQAVGTGIAGQEIAMRIYVKDKVLYVKDYAGAKLEIYDLSGRLVKQTVLSDDYAQIQLSATGAFIVRLQHEGKVITQKIMII